LTKKYGKSDKKRLLDLHGREEIYWWRFAISIGDLSYRSIWETLTTEIELISDGDNYKVNLRIRYYSKELKE